MYDHRIVTKGVELFILRVGGDSPRFVFIQGWDTSPVKCCVFVGWKGGSERLWVLRKVSLTNTIICGVEKKLIALRYFSFIKFGSVLFTFSSLTSLFTVES